VLGEGDRVPADGHVVEAQDLQTDESLLTGESVPVRKRVLGPDEGAGAPRPGGEDLAYVFSGSLVVRGAGLVEVAATGPRSEIGRIGQSLHAVEPEAPRLQAQTRRAVRFFAIGGGAVSLCVVLLHGLTRGAWLDGILAGIAVGMSMLPEEFPVVLTVFMAMGAWRISRARVLTRRAAAIETLGSATVLCTDKTGTLTENRMAVAELRLPDGQICRAADFAAGAPEFAELADAGRQACAAEPADPMEKAFHSFAPGPDGAILRTYGLRPDLLAMSNVRAADGEAAVFDVAAKGAPEAIARLCRLDEAARARLAAATDAMAREGLRVLGVATARHESADLPDSHRDFAFAFRGLVGLADPLRASVPDAVRECRAAGIRVAMITGDYPETARAIARAAGIAHGQAMSGTELAAMDATALAARVAEVSVFARIMPDQKLRIVEALKAKGEVVAMTGDGVNDAPSLKAAHIGIAMGGRGTDVAREAAGLVLLDDDFGSIVKAIRLGRRIYDNLRKAMAFILAVHVPVAGLALLPLLLDLPPVFGPIHIAFLEMVIDPVCSLVFEAEEDEPDVMRRPPRDPQAALFSAPLLGWGIVQGAAALAIVAGIYAAANARGMPVDELRALTFFALVLSIVALIFVNRARGASLRAALFRPNPALLVVLFAVTATLATALAVPAVRELFSFGPLHGDDLAVVFGAGALLLALLEGAKLVRPR
jgi:Ca2+-transporting ATPase